MNIHRRLPVCFLGQLSFVIVLSAVALADDLNSNSSTSPISDENIEVLTRGPLHEAFAEPIQQDATSGPIIAKVPPDPIDEVPPEIKPDDPNAIWISGYWAIDEDRQDFLWVSGAWRIPPDDHRWVPGYWQEVTEPEPGYRWIPGFWIANTADRVEYLPYPPENLDTGPTSQAPSNDYFWVPGSWVYYTSGYRWRPGYWALHRLASIWTPAHFIWTPRGAVYVRGFWDRLFGRRGFLYSPVYFRNQAQFRVGFRYTPRFGLNVYGLQFNLFVRTGHPNYFFGDFYGKRYAQQGFRPWATYYKNRPGFDPVLTHKQYNYRKQGIDYTGRIEGWTRYYTKNENQRPPRTLADQQSFVQRQQKNVAFAQTVLGHSDNATIAKQRKVQNMVRVQKNEQGEIERMMKQQQSISRQRSTVESRSSADPNVVENRLPRSTRPSEATAARKKVEFRQKTLTTNPDPAVSASRRGNSPTPPNYSSRIKNNKVNPQVAIGSSTQLPKVNRNQPVPRTSFKPPVASPISSQSPNQPRSKFNTPKTENRQPPRSNQPRTTQPQRTQPRTTQPRSAPSRKSYSPPPSATRNPSSRSAPNRSRPKPSKPSGSRSRPPSKPGKGPRKK